MILFRSQQQEECTHDEEWKEWIKAGRERMDIVIDSGASRNVLPRDVANEHSTRPGSSRTYVTANNQRVQVDGEKELVCGLMSGTEVQTRWEVGDVSHPLSSVSGMTKSGYRIWFDTEERGGSGCYSYATGETTKIFEKDGIYVLPAWIRESQEGRNSSSSGSNQEAEQNVK